MKTTRFGQTLALFAALCFAIATAGPAVAEGGEHMEGGMGHMEHMEHKKDDMKADAHAEMAKHKAAVYPLDYCIVSGEKLGSMGEPVEMNYEGRDIQLCCNGCVKSFKADPAKYIEKLDAAIIAQQKDNYPLKTCVVSGEELGSMGEPLMRVYDNRLVEFCCGGCIKTFEADPEAYFEKIDNAVIAQQKDSYPLKTCVVTGEPLPAEPIMVVSGTQLVELCCPACKKAVKADPAKYVAKIHEAAEAKKEGGM
ncbi:hypothetical protein KQI84_18030 [bacterium]|nr:hypothetical protein [bacterium]